MPPDRCGICKHPERASIEAAAKGGDLLAVAQSFGVSEQSLSVHVRKHGSAPQTSSQAQPVPLPAVPSSPGAPAVAPVPPAPTCNVVRLRPRGAAPSTATSSPSTAPSSSSSAPCSICAHQDRKAIEAALAGGQVASRVALRFFLDADALRAHASGCLGGKVQAQGEARSAVQSVVARVHALLEEVEADDDATVADRLRVIRELNRSLELLGKLSGEIGTAADARKFERILSAIARELAPYPEVAKKVAAAVAATEAA